MLWKHFATGAGLAAAAANALFIAPEISAADEKIVEALPFVEGNAAAAALQTQTLKLDCPGCPVKMRHHSGRTTTKTDLSSHLELTFAVDTAGSLDRLLVNDFELYPNAASWYSTLRAPQVLDFTKMPTKHPRLSNPPTPQLGYALAVRPLPTDDGQQLSLIEVELQIIEVGYSFNDGIPAVRLKLIQTPSGKLMIASVDVEERKTDADSADTDGVADDDECQNAFCSWRKSILKGLKSLRPGCYRGRQGHGAGAAGTHTHAHGHHHHRRPGHYRHHHTWSRLFQNIVWSIFLPILIGLVAGVGVALIGMMMGTFTVCLWRLAFRRRAPWMRHQCRRRGGHVCRRAARRDAAFASEKARLIESQEQYVPAPPAYAETDERPASS